MSASGPPGERSGSRRQHRDNDATPPGQPPAAEVPAADVPAADVPANDAPSTDVPAVYVSRVDLAKLERLAASLVEHLPPGLMFGLVGTLGAGKTRMTQAIAGALGVDRAEVTSPTFTLVQSHVVGGPAAKVRTLHHLDAYRLFDEDEFLDLGVEELFADPTAWTVVEWADRVVDAMPPETVWVSIELEPPTKPPAKPPTEPAATPAMDHGDELRRIVFRTDDVVTRGALINVAGAMSDRAKPERAFAASEVREGPSRDGAESP